MVALVTSLRTASLAVRNVGWLLGQLVSVLPGACYLTPNSLIFPVPNQKITLLKSFDCFI